MRTNKRTNQSQGKNNKQVNKSVRKRRWQIWFVRHLLKTHKTDLFDIKHDD